MKIAIIGSRGYPYVYSGYETFVKEFGERLIERNHEVTVYCHRNLFDSFPKQVNGINLIYIYTIETKIFSQLIHSTLSMIHTCFCSYDIILVVNSANGPLGLISKIAQKKTVLNVDGLEWLRPKWKGIGSKYFYWASRIGTKLYDRLVTDSTEMEKIYQKEFNAKSTVIAYGANIRDSMNPDLIKHWGLEPNEYYLIVGRLIPDNNADIIIREFVNSKSTKKMVIVGGVPYRDKYVTKIKSIKDNRLIWTGYVNNQEELAELYHNCYVYLHGHEFGGTNPTMLKALAYGCAICALDTVFNREMLEGNKHGVFFTKSLGSCQAALEQLESDPNKVNELKKISKGRIKEYYTWNKITDQYLDLFEELQLTT